MAFEQTLRKERPIRATRQRGEARRLTIIEAAASEFAAKGYEGGSMRAIARALSIELPLIQHHFGDKKSLWDAVMGAVIGAGRREVEKAREAQEIESPAEWIAVTIDALIRFAAVHQDFVALMSHAITQPSEHTDAMIFELGESQGEVIAMIDAAQTDGSFVPGHPVLLFYQLVGAALKIFASVGVSERLIGKSLTNPEVLDEHIDSCLRLFMPCFRHRGFRHRRPAYEMIPRPSKALLEENPNRREGLPASD